MQLIIFFKLWCYLRLFPPSREREREKVLGCGAQWTQPWRTQVLGQRGPNIAFYKPGAYKELKNLNLNSLTLHNDVSQTSSIRARIETVTFAFSTVLPCTSTNSAEVKLVLTAFGPLHEVILEPPRTT